MWQSWVSFFFMWMDLLEKKKDNPIQLHKINILGNPKEKYGDPSFPCPTLPEVTNVPVFILAFPYSHTALSGHIWAYLLLCIRSVKYTQLTHIHKH